MEGVWGEGDLDSISARASTAVQRDERDPLGRLFLLTGDISTPSVPLGPSQTSRLCLQHLEVNACIP